MKLGAITTTLIHRPLDQACATMHELGLEYIELGAGGYFPKNHCNPELLLSDKDALLRFKDTLARHELTISALAMHGEPLNPNPRLAIAYDKEFREACNLAEQLGVQRITLLSGLPEGLEGDSCPNWILYPYPPENIERLEWQWEKRLVPYWKEHGKIAEDHGTKLCFEMHPVDMVYKPECLLRLRDAVGPVVGCNLDPSHLFHQGMDITAVIRTLGNAIYHAHAKDSRPDPNVVRANGILDAKNFMDVQGRSWVFRTVGFGHGEQFWRDYLSTLRLVGYDDVISIEHEDPLIEREEGFCKAAQFLKGLLIERPQGKLWFDEETEALGWTKEMTR